MLLTSKNVLLSHKILDYQCFLKNWKIWQYWACVPHSISWLWLGSGYLFRGNTCPLVSTIALSTLSLLSSGNKAKGQPPAFVCWYVYYLRIMILCTQISTINEKMKDKLKRPCAELQEMVENLFP